MKAFYHKLTQANSRGPDAKLAQNMWCKPAQN